MTHHTDASRESSGTRVDPSRSYPDAPQALTPPSSVSLPLDLQAWERLAREVIETREKHVAAKAAWNWALADGYFLELMRLTDELRESCTPERILGLIGEVRANEQIAQAAQRYVRTFLDYNDGTKDLQACDRAHDQARDALLAAVAALSPGSTDHA